jgi:predicted nuclease of predicted toxin-antitoxin system
MRFLIDNAISPRVARILSENGHDAVHLRDKGMQSAKDQEVFQLAHQENRILVSTDADFGSILALQNWTGPSLILFRGTSRKPEQQAELILLNLGKLADSLDKGCIAVLEEQRIRLRLFVPE